MKKVEDYVRSIPDFPEPGIIFRDVTSILQDADGLQLAIDEMQHFVEEVDCDVICGTEPGNWSGILFPPYTPFPCAHCIIHFINCKV